VRVTAPLPHPEQPRDAESSEPSDEMIDGAGPQRSIALTDGVVAIALTLLALDLKPEPTGDHGSRALAHSLYDHAGQYASFAIAFALIAQFWFAHHRITRTVRHASTGLHLLTMVFLFGITLIPLTTYLTGTFGNPLSTTLFAANIAFVTLTLGLLGEHIHRHRLDDRRESDLDRQRRRIRSLCTLLIPGLVAGLAWVIGGDAAWFYFLFAVADVPGRLMTRRAQPGPATA
jgi:uncharacterized membrane protein